MKTKLSQAIAAVAVMGAATAASAASVNHDGLGQALLFPLYTAEAGNQTTIHLTNTTADFKAVKVRFRRSADSADVLDFNLYLSPYDQWTGVVTNGGDRPVLTSADTSCISAAPQGLADGQEFGVSGDAMKGHIEVIEMANWTRAEAQAAAVVAGVSVEKAVEHVDVDGKRVPGNCMAVHNSWNANGLWDTIYANGVGGTTSFTNANLGNAPTGGLYGNAYVINVDEAWSASFAPTAMNIYDAAAAVPGNNHHAPRFGMPDLQGPTAEIRRVVLQTPDSSKWPEEALQGAVDKLAGIMNTSNYGMDDLIDTATQTGIADVLSVKNLYADYTIGGSSAANTELVVTFPVKYAGKPNPSSQVKFKATFTDREEDRFESKVDSWQWSPWVPGTAVAADAFRFETNLIKLAHESGDKDRVDLGDWNHEIPSNFRSGWVDIEFAAEQVTVNMNDLQKDYDVYLGNFDYGSAATPNTPLTATEYAVARAGLTTAQAGQIVNGSNDGFKPGTRTFSETTAQPVIGISNIVIKNKKAIAGATNTYAITYDLKKAGR